MGGGAPQRPTNPSNPLSPRTPGGGSGPQKPGGAGRNPGPAPGGRAGPLLGGAAQKPYAPFENDALAWLKPGSETAAAALARVDGSKPSVLLFVGAADAANCCAQNFERTIFRDESVVGLVKDGFVAVRVDRTTEDAKGFSVSQPTIVVQDAEGDEVARFISCTQSAWVLGVLNEALAVDREIKARSAVVAPRIARAEKLLADKKPRETSPIVCKALKETRLSRSLRDRTAALVKALGDEAQARMDAARARDEAGDPGQAWSIYRAVRDDYWGLAPSNAAKAAMSALERDPVKKEKLREARAQAALDAARELAETGKKGEAVTELRRIASDFDGTEAAASAKAFQREISDPAWKPAPRAAPPADEEPRPAKADAPAGAPGPGEPPSGSGEPSMPVPPPPPETPPGSGDE